MFAATATGSARLDYLPVTLGINSMFTDTFARASSTSGCSKNAKSTNTSKLIQDPNIQQQYQIEQYD